MSREIIVASWCDRCQAIDDRKEPATHTYTIGLVKGETRPALKVVELCDAHDPMLADLFDLLAKNSIPLEPPTAGKRAPADDLVCRVCGKEFTARTSTVQHVWQMHRPGEDRGKQPARCPECHEPFSAPAMSSHRSRSHGFSALDNAYSGLLT
jgi:uncharacterized C2H2 Zn-finger protein